MPPRLLFIAALVAVLTLPPSNSAAETAAKSPTSDLSAWAVEQMPGGTVTVKNDALVIEDTGGCTVWFRQKLTAPLTITYDVTVVSEGGPHDRLSDLNCFWMANDTRVDRVAAAPFEHSSPRTGKFSDYDSLLTYYVGYGGNENTTTRFRRYDGTVARPLLPEHDLRAPQFLLKPNQTYQIRLVARDGVAEFWRDGERIFTFHDPAPLTSGWFAFRTLHSHLVIRHFRINTDLN